MPYDRKMIPSIGRWRPRDCGNNFVRACSGEYEKHRAGHCVVRTPCGRCPVHVVAQLPAQIDRTGSPEAEERWNFKLARYAAIEVDEQLHRKVTCIEVPVIRRLRSEIGARSVKIAARPAPGAPPLCARAGARKAAAPGKPQTCSRGRPPVTSSPAPGGSFPCWPLRWTCD